MIKKFNWLIFDAIVAAYLIAVYCTVNPSARTLLWYHVRLVTWYTRNTVKALTGPFWLQEAYHVRGMLPRIVEKL